MLTPITTTNFSEIMHEKLGKNLYRANFRNSNSIIIYQKFLFFKCKNIPLKLKIFTLDFSLSAFSNRAVLASSLSWA